MSKSVCEAIFCAVLMGLAGFALTESLQIRGSAAGGSLSPAFFPTAICIFLLFFLGVILLGSIRLIITEKSGFLPDKITGKMTFAWFAVLAELVFYSVIFEPLGYVVSTTLLVFFVVGTLTFLSAPSGERVTQKGSFKLAIFSLIVSATIYVLFSKVFGLVLPTLGVLGV